MTPDEELRQLRADLEFTKQVAARLVIAKESAERERDEYRSLNVAADELCHILVETGQRADAKIDALQSRVAELEAVLRLIGNEARQVLRKQQ